MSKLIPLTAESLKASTEPRWQWYGEDKTLGPCWCGIGGRRCRYGYVRQDYWIKGLQKRRRLSTHILAWLLDHLGPMERDELYLAYCEFRASGLQLDHRCNEPSCRRPSHLNPCTQSENIQAGRERQRQLDLARGREHYETDPDEIEF